MRMALIVAFLFAAATGDEAMAQIFREPCHTDTVCSGVQKGGGRIISCLKTHKADLSQECFAALGHFMLNNRKSADGGGKAAAAGPKGVDQQAGGADAAQQ
jgi:hypothetical protein